jgi:general secretion pathway protein C
MASLSAPAGIEHLSMDLAKHLAQWKEQTPEQWLIGANRYLPPGVTAILVIAIAYQLAALTWALVPGSTGTNVLPVSTAPAGSAPARPTAADYGLLASAHLFGEATKTSAPVIEQTVVDAPDTTLSLLLTGILAADTESDFKGQAIISSNRGQERTYQIGQEIENANGTRLHSVHPDRVLLNRGDRLETLRFPETLSASAGPAGLAGRPSLPPAAAPPRNDSLRQVIGQNASRLTDIIRLAPHVEEGQVVGFRVTPGRDRETFEALGLQPGDVVTDINGTVLDDPSRGLQVFESLGEATMANVTVLREGVPQVIVIDTSQLQSMQEGRE